MLGSDGSGDTCTIPAVRLHQAQQSRTCVADVVRTGEFPETLPEHTRRTTYESEQTGTPPTASLDRELVTRFRARDLRLGQCVSLRFTLSGISTWGRDWTAVYNVHTSSRRGSINSLRGSLSRASQGSRHLTCKIAMQHGIPWGRRGL